MKKFFKLIGNRARGASHQRCAVPLLIIALVAMIGFSIASCGGGGGGPGSGPGDGPGSGPGDGPGWTAVDLSKLGTFYINAIAYGGGKFVAVGHTGSFYNNTQIGTIAYSSDGINWTAVADSTFGTSDVDCITYGNGTFVAGSLSNKMAYSSDGVNWTAVTDSTFHTGNGIYSIAYGGDRFIAVGAFYNSKGMACSTDGGVTWTALAGWFPNSIKDIAYGNNTFVATDHLHMKYSSDNGETWTDVTSISAVMGFHSYGSASFEGIAYGGASGGNGKFVAVGYSGDRYYNNVAGRMAYSSDSVTWTAVSNTTFGKNGIYSIAYGNNTFVAGGGDGKMAYSADGVNWTAVANSPFVGDSILDSIVAIAYGGGRWVVVTYDDKIFVFNGELK